MTHHYTAIAERYIYPAIDEIAAGLEPGHTLHKTPDTNLFGDGAALDSLGLVNLIVAVEERIESGTGKGVRLVSEKAMSRRQSPFRTVSTLAEYIDELLRDAS
ncbi:MAG: acyl carrier protein [candidate division Zixibacteria bacterium]|nr:acyl carrier protein [candidate division Zixibacteria bacterium]